MDQQSGQESREHLVSVSRETSANLRPRRSTGTNYASNIPQANDHARWRSSGVTLHVKEQRE